MKLKKWLRNWLNDDRCEAMPAVLQSGSHGGLGITLYTANGGHVVSFRRYDMKADRSHNALYIITSDQVFEEALAQCIAMERLSR